MDPVTTPQAPAVVAGAIHGPYEDFAIELLRLLGKLIDGQTPDQRAKLWQNWIDFWQPIIDLMKKGKA